MCPRSALRFAILTAALGLLPPPADADPWVLGPGQWYTRFESGVYSSSSIYLDSGFRADRIVTFEQRTASFYGELGFKHGITGFCRLPVVSSSFRDDLGLFYPAGTEVTKTSFQDILLGARFRLLEGRVPTASRSPGARRWATTVTSPRRGLRSATGFRS